MLKKLVLAASALLPLAANAEVSQPPNAYIIAEIEVLDDAGYDGYKAAVVPIVAKYGGRYIVRGGNITSIEGDAPKGRVVVLEFMDVAAAEAFLNSDEYRPVADIRHKTAKSRIMIVEGIIP
jgi:uncharacterized protein (DUF1330 family)